MSFPVVICQFCSLLQSVINVMIVGQLNNEAKLAGAGLGNTFIDIFGMAIWMGLDGAISTLVSQAIGAKEFENCGIYRQRTRLAFTFGVVVCIPIYAFSDKLLVLMG